MSPKAVSFRAGLAVLLIAAAAAPALGGPTFMARLDPYQEVPSIVGRGAGTFVAELNDARTGIEYELSYGGTRGSVLQAHIHIGQAGANGGIAVFLCSNLGNGPAGTPACPSSPGNVSGTLTVEDMVPGATAQGVGTGPFGLRWLLGAIRNAAAYVNVHTAPFPAGELRGQIEPLLTLRVLADLTTLDMAPATGTGAAFYIRGDICMNPVPGSPCVAMGDFQCWGWMRDPSDPSAVVVVSQEWNLFDGGKFQVQGMEDEGPRAVTGGTGLFRNVRGEAIEFDLGSFPDFTGTFLLKGVKR